ncbi:hypothetical protein BSL78_23175 [Apostichopus japonicus]|uniref:VWFC domain-containing protein n=1 Tax=Stichopus japonicus TaxID=307972 RepID=A0A2G8JW66_STIJA|nr:hypothetical protein BSL78_23175 [Apostichopus japonicus]
MQGAVVIMRQRRQRTTTVWLQLAVVLLIGLVSFTSAQEELGSGDYDDSVSVSQSGSSSAGDIGDRNPCSFRGNFLQHKQSTRLDPCTECVCSNGTTTCNIESCPSDAGCDPTEIVVIPEECCPQCPYNMYIMDTHIVEDAPIDFTIGESKRVKFGLDMEIERKLTSRIVRGEDLWKLSTWISPNQDGSGPRYSSTDNVFGEKDAAKEYFKPQYPPWEWTKLRNTFRFRGGTCDDFKYFCVEFGQGDAPRPTYDLSFTMQAVHDEQERLIDCVPLGTVLVRGGEVKKGVDLGEQGTKTVP